MAPKRFHMDVLPQLSMHMCLLYMGIPLHGQGRVCNHYFECTALAWIPMQKLRGTGIGDGEMPQA
jgi:hypothetical protein